MLPLGLSHDVNACPALSIVGPTTAVVAATARLPLEVAAVGSGAGTVTITVAVVGADDAPTSPQPEGTQRTPARRRRPEMRMDSDLVTRGLRPEDRLGKPGGPGPPRSSGAPAAAYTEPGPHPDGDEPSRLAAARAASWVDR